MKWIGYKKAAVILGVIFTIALIALIVINRASIMTFVTSKEKQIKLSDENIQSGFIVSLGEYMYFPNPSDNYKLYKIKVDGTGKTKVSDDSTYTLVLADNWIYYSNYSDGAKLYKIKADGTNRTKITDDGANYITLNMSGIYYSNIKDGNKLYVIGFNGKANKRLSDESVSFINIVGNSIIYRNGSQNIIKINSDGTGRTVIDENKVSFVKADNKGDNIYYSIQSDNRSLYSINKNGGSSTKILKTTTYYGEPIDQWIYFIDSESDNPNTYYSFIYRVKKDGTGLQKLSEEASDKFCINKDKIFYNSLENNGIYTMNLDGTQRKALEGKTIANSVPEICKALKDKVDFDIKDNKMAESYKKAKEVLSEIIKPGMSDIEKELSIHDYLVKNVKYDNEVVNALKNNHIINLDSHDTYNVLIGGKGVCDGFAWTTKLMLGMCGIDSDIVTGMGKTKTDNKIAGKPIYHAWNIVKIDNEFYELDVTWDENIYEQLNMLSYVYFNVSDNQMAKDHEWDNSYYTKCTSTKYNFFSNLEAATRDGSTLYYSNESDKYKLYKININGSENKKINDHKSLFMAVSEGYIYYSDYEDGGALYKMSIDGKGKTKLSSNWCTNIEVKDGYVEYVNHNDKKRYRIKI